MSEGSRLIRVPEAARMLGISVRKVWELLSAGVFKRIKHPTCRVTVMSSTEIDAYIRKLEEGDGSVS